MDEVSVLLLLSFGRPDEGPDNPGGSGAPVINMFLNASIPRAGFLCSFPLSSSCSVRFPNAASLVANVLANGLYGALIAPGPGRLGGGRGPEFRAAFIVACHKSESPLAIGSPSCPSTSFGSRSGGGGDGALAAESDADSLRPSCSWVCVNSGECGGDWILTVFFFFVRFGGATSRQHRHPSLAIGT